MALSAPPLQSEPSDREPSTAAATNSAGRQGVDQTIVVVEGAITLERPGPEEAAAVQAALAELQAKGAMRPDDVGIDAATLIVAGAIVVLAALGGLGLRNARRRDDDCEGGWPLRHQT